MDRALDDIIGERQSSRRGGPSRRGNDSRRGTYRKVIRSHISDFHPLPTNVKAHQAPFRIRNLNEEEDLSLNDNDGARRMDNDWLHDKYDDEDDYGSQPASRFSRDRRPRDRSPDADLFDKTTKLRVENLHYDLTEDDLRDLFTRIAPITDLKLSYDRAGRSLGTAYISYRSDRSARQAIAEFDGANANGQPIRLSIVPSAPAQKRNPFDSVVRPSRSLAERIGDGGRSRGRERSRSPGEERRGDGPRRGPREDIDRYVPRNRDRSRSPRRGGRGRGAPRGGRGGRGRGRADGEGGRPVVQGRPRYTQEELDKDMDSYWGNKAEGGDAAGTSTTAPDDKQTDDIDMVE